MNRSEHQLQVEAFMLRAKQLVPLIPTEPTNDVKILRAKLILEEAIETIRDGLGVTVYAKIDDNESVELVEKCLQFMITSDRPFSMVELIDGCCDVAVVTTGTLSACGVPDLPFQREVDRNNLMKFGPGHTVREDGKLIKPPGHKPPDVKGILQTMGVM